LKLVRHTRWVRRGSLIALVAGLAAVGAAGLALTASGQEATPAPAAAEVVREAPAPAQTELPPLPEMRGTVVEPVAGSGSSAEEPTQEDSGLGENDPEPTQAASSGGRQRAVEGGRRDVTKAVALSNGVALPPLEAPEEVKQIIEAGNVIARSPYKWGGGHGKWLDSGYDCSGSVSFALAAAGLLGGPLASGPLMSWGEPGRGKWVTIYTNPGHVFMEVAGIRFDTSGRQVTGSRWQNATRSTAGFVARHPAGL
jgi:cell wall-associated NlpC family hydrolase